MTSRPPRVPHWLASVLLRGDAREIVIGDLNEAFARRIADGMARRRASRVYWRETVASIVAVRVDRSEPRGARSFTRLFQGVSLDLRYVCRGLAASRGFTAVAILSLAIGIGATTALVNVARTLLVTELPVERPRELSWLFWSGDLKMRMTGLGDEGVPLEGRRYSSNYSYPLYRAIKSAAHPGVEIVGLNILRRLNVTRRGQPPSVASGLIVSGDFFAGLRLPVSLGRAIREADDRDGAPLVVVITDAFWRRAFGGDPAAIGAVLDVNGAPFEIVGVTAASFQGLSRGGLVPPTDVIVPFAAQPVVAPSWKGDAVSLREDFTRRWVRMLARVPAGVAPAVLDAAATTALRQSLVGIVPAVADLSTVDVRLFPGNRGVDGVRDPAAQPLVVLTGVVAIFLLVTCTNLAGMLTARGLARRRELAVRRALGAERWRLVRQALVESLLLAACGGVAGTALAIWSGPALTAMLSDGLDAASVRLPMDWPFLGLAALVTVATAVFFGIVPALRLTRGGGASALRDRAGAGAIRQRAGQALIVVQLAVSVPLLVGALLFLQTLRQFSAVELGFDPEGLVLFEVNPVRTAPAFDTTTPPAADARRLDEVLTRLESIAGVTGATVMENGLITGWTSNTEGRVDDRPARLQMQAVGPRFFETMRMRLVAGRGITRGDGPGAPHVAVINEAAARAYFGSGSPIGRRFTVPTSERGTRSLEVIGVVADARYGSLRSRPAPAFYDSYLQRPGGVYTTVFAVRSLAGPASLLRAIPARMAEVAPNLPIVTLETETATIARSIGRERVLSRLLSVFGGFALLLASLGLHGLTSYAVTRRTSEIGIRLALGAQRSQVLWLILRQVTVVAGAGLVLGLPLAWAAGPLLASYLFGVASRDLLTVAVAALVLTGVALVAGGLPARRAARMDPLAALRVE